MAKLERGEFVLNGVSSLTFGCRIQDRPDFILPERRYEAETALGQDGQSIYDEGAYNDTPLELILVIDRVPGVTPDKLRQVISKRFINNGDYVSFVSYYDPDKTAFIKLKGELKFRQKYHYGDVMEATVPVTVKPWKYIGFKQGVYENLSQGKLNNPTEWTALPIFKFTGIGAFTLNVNGEQFKIKHIDGHITINCQMPNTYKEITGGGVTNKNNQVLSWDYPILKEGNNSISWTSGFTGQIQKQWRSLI